MHTAITARTTINLHASLLERLRHFAKAQNLTMSQIVEAGIRHVIEHHEGERIQGMYDGLLSMKGMCKEPFMDTSHHIDDILYGEDGAWKGNRE